MRIILRNIPAHTSPKELTTYIKPSLDNGLLNLIKRPGRISKINIVAQMDPESNVVRHHGLVTIEPEKAAKRAMQRLNKIPFNGKMIFIREFYNRAKRNDPRKNTTKNLNQLQNRRSIERRIHTLERVTNFGISFSDRSQFARKRGY